VLLVLPVRRVLSVRPEPPVRRDRRASLVLPVRLVQSGPQARRALRDPPELPVRPAQLARRVRPVRKGLQALLAPPVRLGR
jgi:hypothetical protein